MKNKSGLYWSVVTHEGAGATLPLCTTEHGFHKVNAEQHRPAYAWRMGRYGRFYLKHYSSNKLVLIYKVLNGYVISVFIRASSVRFSPSCMEPPLRLSLARHF